jgi:hypoxanthine-guanine phosphoribosyltransferase
MDCVTIKDKTFNISISAASIQERISELAMKINDEYAGKRPLFISVLNGSFLFAADLAAKRNDPFNTLINYFYPRIFIFGTSIKRNG